MRTVRFTGTIEHRHLPGIDTLRAVATVLVVLLHAGIPYASTRIPGLAWPVWHHNPSGTVNAVFWGIEGCVMPVFFWLSGYGAAQSLASRGPREFWQMRWQRIGKPLLIFAAILLPCELYIWLTGWALDGEIAWRKLRSLKLDAEHNGVWGLSHLWYLEYLLLYCALLLAWNRLIGWAAPVTSAVPFAKATPAIKTQGRLSLGFWRGPFRLVTLSAAVTAVLWWSPETVVGFQHSFFPVPAKFSFSGLFFAAGVLTFRCGRNAIGHGYARLVCGAVVMWAAFPLLEQQAAGGLTGVDRFALGLMLGGYAALMSGGLWDLCLRRRAECGPVVRFVSAASYWTYLLHHPVVALCHIALRPTGWPAVVQFFLTAGTTLAVCWISYAWLVRGTEIGALLGEARRTAPQIPDAAPLRRAA